MTAEDICKQTNKICSKKPSRVLSNFTEHTSITSKTEILIQIWGGLRKGFLQQRASTLIKHLGEPTPPVEERYRQAHQVEKAIRYPQYNEAYHR
uniref:Uncharacterized protein n=1 Tax=Sphaerodactylus townsendi TaxID=933632 RepID=A0ACB8EMG3_9SAUR